MSKLNNFHKSDLSDLSDKKPNIILLEEIQHNIKEMLLNTTTIKNDLVEIRKVIKDKEKPKEEEYVEGWRIF